MLTIQQKRLDTHFDTNSGYCYVHARAAELPSGDMVMTMQKLRLSGSDIFSGLEMTRCGKNGVWEPITVCPELSRRPWGQDMEIAMCDATPIWHRATQTLLLTGHTVVYQHDEIVPGIRPRHTAWSVFDETTGHWSPYQLLDMPDGFANCGAGCTQIIEQADGTLLIPAYVLRGKNYAAVVLHCSYDGHSLKLLTYGNILEHDVPRGFCEPSLMRFAGRYFMCIRNDLTSFVTTSNDGLNYAQPKEWQFDDGMPLECYNTQQHWLVCGGRLYLVYTRRAGNNDHVFRHRAPLFIAEVDTERLVVKRSTEQIAVPERGARLGNFCCTQLHDGRAVVIAAEWMQTTGPDHGNFRRCMKYGSDNSIWISTVSC